MKKIFILLLLIVFTQAQSSALIIPEGSAIDIQTEKKIDADKVKEGEFVNFIVARPVKQEGKTLIKAGTEVKAQITKKKNNFIFGVPGRLELSNFQIITSNNEIIRLRGSIIDEGDNRYWAHVGWIFLFPILFIKGDDAKIPINTSYILYTIEDIDL